MHSIYLCILHNISTAPIKIRIHISTRNKHNERKYMLKMLLDIFRGLMPSFIYSFDQMFCPFLSGQHLHQKEARSRWLVKRLMWLTKQEEALLISITEVVVNPKSSLQPMAMQTFFYDNKVKIRIAKKTLKYFLINHKHLNRIMILALINVLILQFASTHAGHQKQIYLKVFSI